MTGMPTWAKAVLRITGLLDVVLSGLGVCFLWSVREMFALTSNSSFPFFRIAFSTMTAVNGVLLLSFLVAAFQLLWLKKTGIAVHSITAASLIAYHFLIGTLWLAGRGVGISIGAATGVGNMGIAPFTVLFGVPYAFPVVSTLVLLITRWKIRSPSYQAALAQTI